MREHTATPNLTFVKLPGTAASADWLPGVLTDLHGRGIQSVLVEGGPTVLGALLAADTWDEIRIFRSPRRLERGIAAPRLGLRGWQSQEKVGEDDLFTYVNNG